MAERNHVGSAGLPGGPQEVQGLLTERKRDLMILPSIDMQFTATLAMPRGARAACARTDPRAGRCCLVAGKSGANDGTSQLSIGVERADVRGRLHGTPDTGVQINAEGA